jgi:hypothetical protein
MFRLGTAVIVSMMLSIGVRAQGADGLAGEWRNPKDTRAIVEARIYSQGGRWMLQLLGSCTPRPCVWDPLPLTVAAARTGAPQATATYSRSNMRRLITLRLGEDALVVTVASHQLAVPARGIEERKYDSIDELRFVKAKTEPLPPRQPAR